MFELMAAGIFILGLILLDRFHHRIFKGNAPSLYLVAEGEIPQLEWLIRDVCSYLKSCGKCSLTVVNNSGADESFILQKLSRRYCFSICSCLPEEAEMVVRIDCLSSPRRLRRDISALHHADGREIRQKS